MLNPQNIIISHVYSSDNKGDAALTGVLLEGLRQRFPAASITILQLERGKNDTHFEGAPQTPGFMYFALNKYRNPLVKLCYSAYMIIATLLWAKATRRTGWQPYLPPHLRQVAYLYRQADLIVAVGGGYIRSRRGLLNRMNVPLLLHPLLFGYLLRKPTVLYSQSVGPFQNDLERWMVTLVLKRMDLILAREDISADLLKTLGVTNNVQRAVDAGFLLQKTRSISLRRRYHISKTQPVVGVTVRAWLEPAQQAAYEQAVAYALDQFIENAHAHIIFIPQVTASKGDDDRIVSRRVHNLMRHKKSSTVVEETGDYHDIKNMYDDLDLLLGTRFHSVIFSLTSFVPVLAIEYEHKTSGIMRDLGLEKWVIKIEDVRPQNLSALLHKLLLERDHYRLHLRTAIPPYVHRAREALDALVNTYGKHPEAKQPLRHHEVVEVEE